MPRAAKKLPRLTIEYGPQAGVTLVLKKARFVIGRAAASDWPVDNPKISRQHAEIVREARRYFIADLGSRNGTFVNGQRLGPERQPLANGDALQLSTLIVFRFEDPAATAIERGSFTLAPGLILDVVTHEVYVHYRLITPALSDKLFKLLEMLVRHKGQVLTKDTLIAQLWPDNPDEATDQMLDSLVARLRRQLLKADPDHHYIVRERGRGLRFVQRD